jgi:hypothetical protein
MTNSFNNKLHTITTKNTDNRKVDKQHNFATNSLATNITIYLNKNINYYNKIYFRITFATLKNPRKQNL